MITGSAMNIGNMDIAWAQNKGKTTRAWRKVKKVIGTLHTRWSQSQRGAVTGLTEPRS
jgi:hypothetical protein